MQSGSLDRQIVIQHATTVQNAAGEEVETWEPFATVWARRLDVRGRERFGSDQRFATRASVYRMRYLSGVSETMRVLDEGLTYQIVGLAGDARQDWAELTVEAVNPGALP